MTSTAFLSFSVTVVAFSCRSVTCKDSYDDLLRFTLYRSKYFLLRSAAVQSFLKLIVRSAVFRSLPITVVAFCYCSVICKDSYDDLLPFIHS